MAIESLITVLGSAMIGAGASLAGAYLTQTKQQDRWYTDYFLQRKVDALAELHAKLANAKRVVLRYAQNPSGASLTESEAEDVFEAFHAYSEALDQASIFIDPSDRDELIEFYNTFLAMIQSEDDYSLSPESVNLPTKSLEDFHAHYENAQSTLRDELNKPIERMEKER